MSGGSAPRRFYREASIVPMENGHALHLDGRLARTPARVPLQAASAGVMALVAAEWNAQSEVLDPPSMPVTRLVNVAIDGVAPNPEAVAAEIVRYAGSDLVCYRAAGPDALVELQGCLWDPVLEWARDHLGARFRLGEGWCRSPSRRKPWRGSRRLWKPIAIPWRWPRCISRRPSAVRR